MSVRPRNRLAEVMAKSGVTPRDLAVELDVTEGTVRRWLPPEAGIPVKYLHTLVSLFDVTSDHLLGLDRSGVVERHPERLHSGKVSP